MCLCIRVCVCVCVCVCLYVCLYIYTACLCEISVTAKEFNNLQDMSKVIYMLLLLDDKNG